jgi:hypothetical protein
MPQVGFKPTIPVLEGAKTFHALDRATTVTGIKTTQSLQVFHQRMLALLGQYKMDRLKWHRVYEYLCFGTEFNRRCSVHEHDGTTGLCFLRRYENQAKLHG